MAGAHRVKKEWPTGLIELEAPLDIALYLKIIEELEKMKAE